MKELRAVCLDLDDTLWPVLPVIVREGIAPMRAGFRTVWINRAGRSWPAELEPPEATASDLAGLCRQPRC